MQPSFFRLFLLKIQYILSRVVYTPKKHLVTLLPYQESVPVYLLGDPNVL